MLRAVMVALLTAFVESAVNFVELKYSGAASVAKRLAAWKYVKDRFGDLEDMLGRFGIDVPDSVIFGMVDATVLAKNRTGEFTKTEGRPVLYDFPKRQSAFEWVNPETGVKSWGRISAEGEIVAVALVTDPATGKKVPEPDPAGELGGEGVLVESVESHEVEGSGNPTGRTQRVTVDVTRPAGKKKR